MGSGGHHRVPFFTGPTVLFTKSMDRHDSSSRRRVREKDRKIRKRRREKEEPQLLSPPHYNESGRRRKRAPIKLTLRLRNPKPVQLKLSARPKREKMPDILREQEMAELKKFCDVLNFPWINANVEMHIEILKGKAPGDAWLKGRMADSLKINDVAGSPEMIPKINDMRNLCRLLLKHVLNVKDAFEKDDDTNLKSLYDTKLAQSTLRLFIQVAKSRPWTKDTFTLLKCVRHFLFIEVGSFRTFPWKCANFMVNELSKRDICLDVYCVFVDAHGSIPEEKVNEFRWTMNYLFACPFMFFTPQEAFPHIRKDVMESFRASARAALQYSETPAFIAFAFDIANFPTLGKKGWFNVFVPTVLNSLLRLRVKMKGKNHIAIMGVVLRELSTAASDVKKYVTSFDLNAVRHHEIDVLFAALCTENVQRDLLRTPKYCNILLNQVDKIYSSVTQMFHGRPVLSAERQAEKAFGWAAQELDYDPYIVAADRERAVCRVLGFCFELAGYLDYNVFHKIAMCKEKNDIGRVFKWLFRLQRCVRRTIKLENKKMREIVSIDDANAFSIQFERVRTEVMRFKKDVKPPKKPEAAANAPQISFPPITCAKDFTKVISSQCKVVNFENDPNLLSFMSKQYKDNGEELLSRFDPKMEHAPRWSLIDRNIYVAPAKAEIDKQVSMGMCNCIFEPGRDKCVSGTCENMAMKVECSIRCGENCGNRRLQRGTTAKTRVIKAGKKGLGLVAKVDIKAGEMIGEYCGEVIDKAEFQRRVKLYHEETHFYFMQLSKEHTIDASRRSGITRYINHSCSPNCDTEKWTVCREKRIAIVANCEIKAGEELTFNYSASALSLKDKACVCGSEKCNKKLTTQDERLAKTIDEAGGGSSGSTNRRERKLALARHQLHEAVALRKEAKAAVEKRKEMIVNEKAIEEWREKQKKVRKTFRIPRKQSKFQPAAPRGWKKKEEILATGGTAARPGWPTTRKRQWGFDNAAAATETKANKVQKTENRHVRKQVFQPAERAEDRRRRQREQGRSRFSGGGFNWHKKHKTEEERRIEEYDSQNSDYSEISDGVPAKEDAWEYEVPELGDHNPYKYSGGRYGEPICRIDAGKFSNVYAERKYNENKRR